MATDENEFATDEVLQQGDALLRSSRDLLAELDRQLGTGPAAAVDEPGDTLRIDRPATGDS